MRSSILAVVLTLALAPAAMAQTTPTPSTPTSPSTGMPETAFKSADKNNDGFLEGAELSAHRAVLSKVDTNNDGKISQAEYTAGVQAGHIK